MIELRSDTFTLPTPVMIAAIAQADLGDDVYGEDRTVNELETVVAEMFGKEAAMLVPSGTMANLTALMAHCPRGTKALVGNESDIYMYEAGGASVCGGIIYEPVPTQSDGRLLLEDLQRVFPNDPADPQFALPALICLENTHNRMGGRVLPLSYLQEVQVFAHEHRVPVHIDGARVFNAATALGIPVSEIAQYADSLQFCLSKGLCAPACSIVVGRRDFIQRARGLRKMLGGGMRQAGVLAAPGLVAVRSMTKRLEEDHRNALRLARGLATIEGILCDPERVETNIVFFHVADRRFTWQSFLEEARLRGVNLAELGYGRIRAVTHANISCSDIDRALEIIQSLLRTGPMPGRA
ncbi:MAG TPA: low-specificity L-threonine aldolase [Ktedonobacteraceae bacterium]|nr:low-specificity L-threonine aldolase [Ktedonobacteraceae bacterium]